MHQPAQIVPLIHAAKLNSVAHSDWHAVCEIDVVGDQQ